MANLLQSAGSQDPKGSRYAPIFQNRFFTGLWLQRNPLNSPGTRVENIYYGGRPEAIISGVNVELTNLLTLARRYGSSAYSLQTVSEAINSFYSFKSFTAMSETIQVMMDGLTQIYTISPASVTRLFTKNNGAGQTSFFGINNSLYMGDGVDQIAWPGFAASSGTITNTVLAANVATYTAANNFVAGRLVTVTGTANGSGVYNVTNATIATASATQFTVAITHANVGTAADTGTATQNQTRNWGIAPGGISSSSAYAGTGASASAGGGSGSQGPGSPTAAINDASFGSTAWTSPANVFAADSSAASVTLAPTTSSQYIKATGYGFTVPPNATITGIAVSARVKASNILLISDKSVRLYKAGVLTGSDHTNGSTWGTGFAYQNYGSSSDLWGAAWTPADVNNANFGIAYAAYNYNTGGASFTGYVDYLSITVYYTTPLVVSWTNPTNVQGAPDAAYATATPVNDIQTVALFATNYGFAVTGTVTGVQISVTGHVSAVAGDTTLYAQLQDQNGNAIGSQKSLPLTSTGDVVTTFGSSTDLWSGSITPTVVNNTNFGVQIVVSGSGQIFSIDSAQIQVSTASISVAVNAGAGTFSAVTGYQYGYSYANTNVSPSVFSNMSPASTSTGVFTNKLNVGLTVVASSDPQVNAIWVFRTKDGGATFYSLPSNPYPNTSTTITDTAADSTLNQFQLPAQSSQNTPPPAGIGGMAFHMGRLWGFVNNVLYYATGTDLGNILGNPYESWSPANVFTFPSKISKIIPTSVGLLVFTISDVYIVYGTGSALAASTGVAGITVFYPAPFIQNLGLLSQFAADVNGTTIYLHSADKQCLQLDPSSGISKIGFPIGAANLAYPSDSNLSSFNPASTYVTWHAANQDEAVHISDGSTGWFRCNTSQAPDGGFVWSPKANIVGGCQAVQSIETSPGVHQLLIGPGTGGGSILYRDTTAFTDNGTAYASNFIMGSIVLAYPGQIAELAFITCDYNKVGTAPVLSVLLNEISGTFQNISGFTHSDPPMLYGISGGPATLFSTRYDFRQTSGGGAPLPAWARHMQVKIDFGSTDGVRNEIFTFTLVGAHHAEL